MSVTACQRRPANPDPPVEVEGRDSLPRVIDDVDTLARWAGTFRRLAEVDPIRCAGLIGAAQHLERVVDSAAHQPADSDRDGTAPGRVRVDLRATAKAGAR